jgi:hypothetical protein
LARMQRCFRDASGPMFAKMLIMTLPRTAPATRFVMGGRQLSRQMEKPKQVIMTTRSRREQIVFKHSFRIKGIEHDLAAGTYEVVTDEEMIEGLSFPCFRRLATLIMIPGASPHSSSIEMISINPVDLTHAQDSDARLP